MFLFLGVRLLVVGQSHQIVQADVVMDRQLDCKVEGEGAFPTLVFGIQGLVAQQEVCDFLLCQVLVFSKISDSQMHASSPMPSITQDNTSY